MGAMLEQKTPCRSYKLGLKIKIVDDKLIRVAAGRCLMETVMRRLKLTVAENIRGGDLMVIGLPAGLLSAG